MLNIYSVLKNTRVEGPGNRYAIWVQGCSRRCKGCFATETWSSGENLLYDEEELANDVNSTPNIEGVTILGGEPFEQAGPVARFLSMLDKRHTVVIFTGYTTPLSLNAPRS